MLRDVSRLTSEPFDLAVVGGGIYGVCAAWRAALNGLRVCLLEARDFGSATSWNSLKIIHGGLRYLQHLDFRRMRESIHERSVLLRIAPHLVTPMPFIVPTYGHGVAGREAHAIALRMNDWIGWDRNRDLSPSHRLPSSRMLGRVDVLERFPGIPREGLSGGALWYDGLSFSSERLLIAFLRSAWGAGAVAANYVEVVGAVEQDGAVVGLNVRDALTGREMSVRSRMVLNAAGPWVDEVLGRLGDNSESRNFHPSLGLNLVTRQLFPETGLGVRGPSVFHDGQAVVDRGFRLLFIVPWRGYSVIGTRHLSGEVAADGLNVPIDEVHSFLNEINAAYPPAKLKPTDVIGAYRGMLPRDPTPSITDDVQLEKHARVIDHESEGGPRGVMTIVGVKWTTARHLAFEAVDRITRKLGGKPSGRSAEPPSLLECPRQDLEEFLGSGVDARPREMSVESAKHVLLCYGTESTEVFRLASEDPKLRQPLVDGSPVIGAQLVHAARAEMALHLDDVLLRRTELAIAAGLDESALRGCAQTVGSRLQWSNSRIDLELDRVRRALDEFRLPTLR